MLEEARVEMNAKLQRLLNLLYYSRASLCAF